MSLMTVFVLVGMALTIISFVEGMASMAHGGESDQRRSHIYMFRRVGWQALTILFLLLALFATANQ